MFMYLFATIALYFSTWSVINLLLQYINVAFPDSLNPYYQPGDSIRWSMAFLIIIFPAYLWVARFLHRDLLASPEKSEVRIRRWLLYLTLFLAALLIIGDLVALIYNFLGGEITMRFVLKVLSVLVVAVAVFWYYIYDLRAKATKLTAPALLFVRGVMVVVGVIIIVGFFVAGSPFRQRLVRFDEQKVSDLQNIQWQAVNYWQAKEKLPQTLDDLKDTISGYSAPLDPQSGAAYEYRPTGKLAFDLCAEFNLTSQNSQGKNLYARPYPVIDGSVGENWEHGAGRVCFSRTIDPELYKPQKFAPQPVPIIE